MVMLTDLWLAIVLATVLSFFASFLAWAILPHHKADWKSLASREHGVMKIVRDLRVPPGQYIFPYADNPSDLEYKQRLEGGCVGTLTIFKGPPNMGRNMAMTVLGFLLASFFIGYVASHSRLEPGARYLDVFQLTGAMAFAIYAFGGWSEGVWFGKPARAFITNAFDAFVYAMLTAGCFAGFWPDAAAAIPA